MRTLKSQGFLADYQQWHESERIGWDIIPKWLTVYHCPNPKGLGRTSPQKKTSRYGSPRPASHRVTFSTFTHFPAPEIYHKLENSVSLLSSYRWLLNNWRFWWIGLDRACVVWYPCWLLNNWRSSRIRLYKGRVAELAYAPDLKSGVQHGHRLG